jgi:ankyrin repeat protein
MHGRACVDDLPFMQWLIDRGANIKARSSLGSSTLSKAIVHGNIDVVHYLLAQQEDVNRGDLLHCAAERENQDEGAMLVKELVEMGAKVDAHRYLHDDALKFRYFSRLGTPLHTACYEKNLLVAKALLDHGANLHCKMLLELKETGPTPLELAVGTGDPRWIDLFMAKDFLDARL